MKKLTMTLVLLMMLCSSFLITAEGVQEQAMAPAAVQQEQAKYVILLIGDGMSTTQIAAAEAYLGAQRGVMTSPMSFQSFTAQGLTTTYASDRFITDSAAAGTAIATGSKTYCGAISVDESGTPLKTLVEYAQDLDLATGIVSTTRITHATPAVFASHNVSRNEENDIAADIADSGVDYIAGGGYRNFIGADRGLKTKRTDGMDLISEMERQGYRSFVSESMTDTFRSWNPKAGEKVVALMGASHLDYAIDEAHQPTLAELTAKGIDLLSKDQDGFFLMVEGGRIDHACHANDGMTSIGDTLAFDEAVQVAAAFYQQHPNETLVVVTGDHETGGLTLGFAGTKYESAYGMLGDQSISYENYTYGEFAAYKAAHTVQDAAVTDLIPSLESNFGLYDMSESEIALLQSALERSLGGEVVKSTFADDYLLYGGYEPFVMEVTHILNRRAGLGWTSYSHTAVPIATFAIGQGSDAFMGYYDNTDIFTNISAIMGVETL